MQRRLVVRHIEQLRQLVLHDGSLHRRQRRDALSDPVHRALATYSSSPGRRASSRHYAGGAGGIEICLGVMANFFSTKMTLAIVCRMTQVEFDLFASSSSCWSLYITVLEPIDCVALNACLYCTN